MSQAIQPHMDSGATDGPRFSSVITKLRPLFEKLTGRGILCAMCTVWDNPAFTTEFFTDGKSAYDIVFSDTPYAHVRKVSPYYRLTGPEDAFARYLCAERPKGFGWFTWGDAARTTSVAHWHGTGHKNAMLTKKRLLWATVLFFLFTCTPLQEYIFWPDTLTIRGTLPQGMHAKALSTYWTESRLCRSFSLGMGQFIATGSARDRVEVAPDASGNFELEIPVENNSLWCHWRYEGVLLSASPPPP